MSNNWIEHVKKIQKKNPGLSYKDALIVAKKTYKKKSKKYLSGFGLVAGGPVSTDKSQPPAKKPPAIKPKPKPPQLSIQIIDNYLVIEMNNHGLYFSIKNIQEIYADNNPSKRVHISGDSYNNNENLKELMNKINKTKNKDSVWLYIFFNEGRGICPDYNVIEITRNEFFYTH